MNNIIPNIVSSSCVGQLLYKIFFNCKYPNPFMGNMINGDDFIYLINNFNSIDLLNIKELTYNIHNFSKSKETYGLCIDNNVNVLYPHNDVKESVKENFIRRLNNFTKENICFILDVKSWEKYKDIIYTQNNIIDFCTLNNEYKKILCVADKTYKKYETDNCKIIIKDNLDIDKLVPYIYKNYKNFLLN